MRLLPAAYQLPEIIRPRQCPEWGWISESDQRHHLYGGGEECPSCGGVGFLYPPAPDWWETDEMSPGYGRVMPLLEWQELLLFIVWRVLKVMEDTE